ncbi:MFS transporter [Luteibacter sp. 22Crub2.1]|uniref:MFS transporter n=1 Tax=Luteibacter sp. 22Crub2.1 TaxID=1283288 RepID=UPI0009A5FB9F|nr:MFS transporter [Luteibacter sp. 22Crub2.1]SKB67174.1 Predicted arabinose efflux permease, MFS family [Luteibacter sp. 22Crub2.1]
MIRALSPQAARQGLIAFLIAFCCSGVAIEMAATAVAWQLYATTGRASDLGLIGLARFLPSLIFVLPAGHMADRYDRRLLVGTAQAITCLALAGLWACSATGAVSRLDVLALVNISGIAAAIRGPAFQSMVPGLVPASGLARASAASAAVDEFASIAGPVFGGLLYLAGPATVYAIAALLTIVSGALVTRLPYQQALAPRIPVTRKDLFAGVHFIRARPDIIGVISLDLFAVLLGGATALLPVFAKDVLHTGPLGLGMLRMAPSIGAVAVGLWLARYPLDKRVGHLMFGCVAGFGLSTIGFALSTQLWTSLLALVLLGGFDMVSMVIRSALVQIETPDAMRGRVGAINSIFVNTSNQLGAFESGMLAAWVGAVPAVIVGGVGTLLVTALWMHWFPGLRQRQTLMSDTDVSLLA